jgi:hypothetical protein
MTRQELEQKIKATESEIKSLDAQIAPYEALRLKAWASLRQLKAELDVVILQEEPDNIDFLIKDARQDSLPKIKAVHKLAQKLHLHPVGYWHGTNEQSFSVQLNKNENVSKVKTSIEYLTPYYTPRHDGKVWYGIFEHTLSQYYTYYLKVEPDLSTAYVTTHRESNPPEYKGSLEEVLNYIAKYHWYKD